MKRLVLLVILLPLLSVSAFGQNCSGSQALMKHVYRPERLVVQKGCITVKGTIMKEVSEKDGDFHIRLKLDPGQDADLINAKNKSGQGGFLVVEPICVRPVTQASAKKACKNFKQNISLPNVGSHVSVSGIHMLDTDHGWLEVHPVTSIKVLH